MKQYLLPSIFFFSSTFSVIGSAELPDSFSANYELHYDDLRIGLMERQFTRNDDGTGVFESYGKLTGLAALFRKDKIVEKTKFAIDGDQLRPLQYSYSRTGGDKEKSENHQFNWDNSTVSSKTHDGENQVTIKTGLMDKLLYQLAMMEIEDPKTGLNYELIDGMKLKNYQFEFKGKETLKTPMGKLEAFKFQRIRPSEEQSKRSTILWCAPSLHYLPIRVDNIDRKGHLTSIIIKDVEGLD